MSSGLWGALRRALDDEACAWGDAIDDETSIEIRDLIRLELAALYCTMREADNIEGEDARVRLESLALQQRKQLFRLVQAVGTKPVTRQLVPPGPGLSLDEILDYVGDLGDDVIDAGGGRGRRAAPVD